KRGFEARQTQTQFFGFSTKSRRGKAGARTKGRSQKPGVRIQNEEAETTLTDSVFSYSDFWLLPFITLSRK
ncbi:MAG TPA: hypothetical protein VGN95_05005, partial [Pyrinomonadaceae bacterium]|nr:hypothetical protein [Pyrinomonadaceae bacterium]